MEAERAQTHGHPLIPQICTGYYYGTSTHLRTKDTQMSKTGFPNSGRTSEGSYNRAGIESRA